MRVFVCFLGLCFAALNSALAISIYSPLTVNGSTTIGAERALDLFRDQAIFLDVRAKPNWDAERIPGAQNIPFGAGFTQEKIADQLAIDQPIVVYCDGINSLSSAQAVASLKNYGFTEVYYFRSGYPAWVKNHYAVE